MVMVKAVFNLGFFSSLASPFRLLCCLGQPPNALSTKAMIPKKITHLIVTNTKARAVAPAILVGVGSFMLYFGWCWCRFDQWT